MDTRTSPGRCRIRPFVEADRAVLRRLFLEIRRQVFVWMDPEQLDITEFDAATADELVLVAEGDGCPVGFISLWLPENFVHNLFVSPDWQNRGVGTRLLEAGKRHLGRPAHLKCSIHNTHARTFYESRGWTVASRGGDRENGYLNMVCFDSDPHSRGPE